MSRNTSKLLALVVIGGAGALVAASRRKQPTDAPRMLQSPQKLRARAARGVDWSAAMLAASALSDSAMEHYRGSFHNKTMYVPIAVAALTLASSLRDALSADGPRHPRARQGVPAISTGAIGTGFHVYNILKRPGGLSWHNLLYAAPVGAPASLSLAGLLRRFSSAIWRRGDTLLGLSAPSTLVGLVVAGLLGSCGEAALLHYRGAYQNPAMFIPVTVPPVVAALLTRAAFTPGVPHPWTRRMLRLLVGIGFAGAGFHAYGIHRAMGGWKNWSQNLLNGPPLPAPPAFTALALAGLAALDLIDEGIR